MKTQNNANPESQAIHTQNSSDQSKAHLAQVFNTVLVSTFNEELKDASQELSGMMETPAFECLIQAVHQLSTQTGMSETEAAREMIKTFRKIDKIWTEFLISEGVGRLKTPLN